ncbi:MAG: helix-turn-helix transcriptional regulator [Elusimicrobiaceae bacterium]|nr:helix-turn-helix transcriptional regulator [Elusimicrobiaceae bacterium]
MTRNKNEEFIKKLKIALLESHLNSVSLAKKLGIQPGSVSKWMTGENNPKLSTLKKIAKTTGKPINYFFDNFTEVKGNKNIVQSKNVSTDKMDYEKEILLIKKELEIQRYKLENLQLKLEKNKKK